MPLNPKKTASETDLPVWQGAGVSCLAEPCAVGARVTGSDGSRGIYPYDDANVGVIEVRQAPDKALGKGSEPCMSCPPPL
jgi:hypothetical protein